ncbi:surfeit locus 1 family protein [Cribrihabitans marinus]|uniref:SURF1-like protein n=1 Tax=Cribrihabitans marinus TaxID=1227549 RepID=A0A1H7ANK2_9RHOB|nr:SURF1 family protein [Cribrihabitans marinus]GGH32192.1 SURF1-like protein [Cribrihabitans marinus]SEJ67193.1 surfeit locus 1 family protein [Cribrihabitans marinus]
MPTRRLLFVLTFGLVGLAVLLGLGIWQVQRLAWKEALLAEIDARIAAAPVALPVDPDPDTDRYLPVRAEGTFDRGEVHVLVSVKRVGPGYRIIAPFRTGGRRILVDRGFVPTEAKDAPRATGPIQVTGNLHWPDEIDGYTPEPDKDGNIWFARDVPALAEALDTEPVLLIARTPTDPDVTPLPVDSAGIPNDHLHYAITWFGLAAVWAAMTVYFLRRGRSRSESVKP